MNFSDLLISLVSYSLIDHPMSSACIAASDSLVMESNLTSSVSFFATSVQSIIQKRIAKVLLTPSLSL
jgi:hypothetical protein